MTWMRWCAWVCSAAVLAVACGDSGSADRGGDPEAGAAGEPGDTGAGDGGTGPGSGGAGQGGSRAGANSSGGRAGSGTNGGDASGGSRNDAGSGADVSQGGTQDGGESSGGSDPAAGAGLGGDDGESGSSSGGNAGSGDGNGGDGGSGCSGGLEEVVNDFCVAKMASVPSQDDGNYLIDRTEVTRGQYAAWLATNPSPTPVVITACSLNTSYAPNADCVLTEGTLTDHHPIACVDWCDARFYCAAVGKRLCGSTSGGGAPYDPELSEWRKEQWGQACNAQGSQIFTYGEPYDPSACNSEGTETLPVASLSSCQSSVAEFSGVYDMNGNVKEWVDQCSPQLSANTCYARGGGFNQGSVGCSSRVDAPYRLTVEENLGFRCCKDET